MLTLGWTSRLWDAFQRSGARHVGGTVGRPAVSVGKCTGVEGIRVLRCVTYLLLSLLSSTFGPFYFSSREECLAGLFTI